MQMEGSLELLSLPTLVQLIAQEGHQALIQLESNGRTGLLYIEEGLVCHALLKGVDENSDVVGEDAVYEILNWQAGQFFVSSNVSPPEISIRANWDFLLMEGLRRMDEQYAQQPDETVDLLSENILSNLSDVDSAILREIAAQQKENINMANLNQTLEAVMAIDGAVAAALVDWESGLTLGTIGNGINIDLAAAGNTNVVRAKLSVMRDLKLKGGIEDILITLTEQYHLIRLLENNPNLFLYVALRRDAANLGLARHRVSALEKDLVI